MEANISGMRKTPNKSLWPPPLGLVVMVTIGISIFIIALTRVFLHIMW